MIATIAVIAAIAIGHRPSISHRRDHSDHIETTLQRSQRGSQRQRLLR